MEEGRLHGIAEGIGLGVRRLSDWESVTGTVRHCVRGRLDLRGPDLSGMDLRREDLEGSDMRGRICAMST